MSSPSRLLPFAAALCLLLTACATPPGETNAGETATRGIAEGAERDRVLHACREAAAALRAGRDDLAKSRLDEAIARIGGIITDDASAARARGLFAGEDAKVFIGEPYERVMVYYYRGLLYWRDGEPDNARACFRSGSFIDAGATEEKHDADYVLLDYLDGLATVKLQGNGAEALARARAHAGERRPLPDYNPAANVLVFAEYGHGPRKYAAGPTASSCVSTWRIRRRAPRGSCSTAAARWCRCRPTTTSDTRR